MPASPPPQNGTGGHRTVNREPEPRPAIQAPNPGANLPRPVSMAELRAAPPERPKVLVHGIIHRSAKTIIIGGSKSFKTWSFLDLAVSVAAGSPWWDFQCEQGKVLYVNFEIHDAFFADRFEEVCEAKSLDEEMVVRNFDYLGLRGHAGDLTSLAPKLAEYCQGSSYAMIVLDPLYKCLGGRDENSAGDMADLMNVLDRISTKTGAAIVFGHHFSKGNQSKKDMIDRGSGSGVMGRDPDTIITMTAHQEDDAFAVELKLRNFPPQPGFVVKRHHPLMVRDSALRPQDLRSQNGTGRPQTVPDAEVLALLDGQPLSKAEWKRRAEEELEMPKSSFYRRLEELLSDGAIVLDGSLYRRTGQPQNPVAGSTHRVA